MNDVERLLLEQMESENTQSVINDNFSFADSMIDARDLERIERKENNG